MDATINPSLTKPTLLLLDVYDTLLDMSLIVRRVNELLDNKQGYNCWFEVFMQYCFVDNCMRQFHDFSSIAKATLKMAAKQFNRVLNEDQLDDVFDLLKHLPLQEGVQPGLSLLRDQGYTIAALTNSPAAVVSERMEPTGLVSYFEMVLSAEQIKKYKPDIEVYKWAAKTLKTPCEEILFVSAHGWDIAGAAAAGMQTAYLKQPDKIIYPLAPEPSIVSTNLEELAQKLEALYLPV